MKVLLTVICLLFFIPFFTSCGDGVAGELGQTISVDEIVPPNALFPYISDSAIVKNISENEIVVIEEAIAIEPQIEPGEPQIKPREPQIEPEKPDPLPYLIYVSKNSFTIAILGKNDAGEYTELIHTFPTAVGRTNALTRAGEYTITERERWHNWISGSYSPYATMHSGGLFFHGPTFTSQNSDTLIAETYNEIGTKATSGCMRTTSGAAAWIFENCPDGTPVIIANDSLYTSERPERLSSGTKTDPTDPEG